MDESTFEWSNRNVLKQSARAENENVLMLIDMFDNSYAFD